MFIISIGTAVPPMRYSQHECWQALCAAPQFGALARGSQALLRKILTGNSGIEYRHLAYNDLREAFELNPDASYARFTKHAPALAATAAARALAAGSASAEQIDAVVVSTCTGYVCPGLSSYVLERLGLRPTIRTFDLVGQGCGAALPNLALAHALIAAHECSRVLCICVEVCSAAFFLDDDPGVLVSACLFGDGAAAALVARTPEGSTRGVRWHDSGSLHNPFERDCLRFEQRGGMLRNILAKKVPLLAADYVGRLVRDSLARNELRPPDLTGWILHAGGREVLVALEKELGLPAEDLKWSRAILRDYGNLSSSSVLFTLQAALDGGAPGGPWWMSAFGAGFSCHGALLYVE